MRGPIPVGRLWLCCGILTVFAGTATKSLPAAPERPVRPIFAVQDGPSSIQAAPVTAVDDRRWRRHYGRNDVQDAETPDDAGASRTFGGGPPRGYFPGRARFDRRRNFYRPRYYGRRFYRPRYYRRPALPPPYYGPGYGGGFYGPGLFPPAPYGSFPRYGGFGLGFYGPGYSGWYGSGW